MRLIEEKTHAFACPCTRVTIMRKCVTHCAIDDNTMRRKRQGQILFAERPMRERERKRRASRLSSWDGAIGMTASRARSADQLWPSVRPSHARERERARARAAFKFVFATAKHTRARSLIQIHDDRIDLLVSRVKLKNATFHLRFYGNCRRKIENKIS